MLGILRFRSIWLMVMMLLLFLGMSYFGRLNPHLSGMLSGVAVVSFAMSCLILMGMVGVKFFTVFAVVVWLFLSVITVSNWWYFEYFQAFYNFDALWMIADAPSALKSFSVFSSKVEAIVLVTSTFICLFFAIRFYSRAAFRSGAAVFILTVALGASGGVFYIIQGSVERYKELNMFRLAPSYFHPAHAFFLSTETNKVIGSKEVSSLHRFEAMNDPVEPLMPKGVARQGKKYNVIVIVLESIRANMLGAYGSQLGLTPNLDQFAQENIFARNFYANTNYTVKGEVAVWCGILDHNSKPPISKYHSSIESLNCLPNILMRRGYQTWYFHGNSAKFYDRDKFLSMVGFENTYFHEDLFSESRDRKIGWGIADEHLFEIMLDKLEGVGPPFFANITTLSSHYPFSWDWHVEVPVKDLGSNRQKMFNGYKNAVYYEDFAFGQFWQRFRQSTLFEDTIVVVTGDHGVWTFGDNDPEDLLRMNDIFFRMPLLIYHPDNENHNEIKQVSSQLDIPPTLLAMMGFDGGAFIGKNMLNPVGSPWAIMMKSGQVVVRIDDMVCYTSSVECSGIHQECVAHTYGEVFFNRVEDIQQCVKISGDLLGEFKLEEIKTPGPWINSAFDLINLHNKTVFSKAILPE